MWFPREISNNLPLLDLGSVDIFDMNIGFSKKVMFLKYQWFKLPHQSFCRIDLWLVLLFA